MAFNTATFKTRSMTAFVFVLVMLTGLLVNLYFFITLFSLVMLGALYEFGKIIKLIHPRRYFLFFPLGLIYIVLPCIMMISIGIDFTEQDGLVYLPLFPCAVMFSIWINDTMAYLIGSMIGRTPLSPVSPKKTWEGTVGGILATGILIPLIGTLIPFSSSIGRVHWFSIAAICAVLGTLGDLLESKLKRLAGIKDSGSFMPGHGGFLDRFDSMLLSVPFVWIYVEYVIK